MTFPFYLRRAAFVAAFDTLRKTFNWSAHATTEIAPDLGEKGAVIFLSRGKHLTCAGTTALPFNARALVSDNEGNCVLVYRNDVVVDPIAGRQVWPSLSKDGGGRPRHERDDKAFHKPPDP